MTEIDMNCNDNTLDNMSVLLRSTQSMIINLQ